MPAIAESTLLTREQAFDSLDRVCRDSQAEGVSLSLVSGDSALSRFASNQMTQNVQKATLKLRVTSHFGSRSASAATTDLAPEAIAATLRRSETLARIAPEDPEWLPLLEPQAYAPRAAGFDPATAACLPQVRGQLVRQVCQLAQQAGAEASGTLSSQAYSHALLNSRGLQAYECSTEAEFSVTLRQGTGSSWRSRTAIALDELPIVQLTQAALVQAARSQNPRDVQPGAYPTILSSAAMAALVPWLAWNLSARAAAEGRSFFARPGGGDRQGDALFSPLMQLTRDPTHALLQAGASDDQGLPNERLDIVRDGVLQQLNYDRYWAQQQGCQPTGSFEPLVMAGSDRPLAELIAETERGLLINRAWYVRYVNPRQLELTGMTRDGTFWIEAGKIAYPVKNLRFNQSLPALLRDIDALSQVERHDDCVMPGARVTALHFSSVTDSI
ncbi:MAG: TldD/PmbA family protein [Spirulinaceae cyanobacterium SM2_1_0]|nr:TldD/PmbA family protein [Spirulinaceae cyanobacterium SM2_1_0]